MKGSTALAMVLLLASCTSSKVKAAERPSGATKGQPVATVLVARFAQGAEPVIRDSNKKEFAAQGGLPLLSTDLLRVPVGAFLLLDLSDNHHVVRIDEDLEMRVGEIALLGAPAHADSVASQLDRLLTPEDKKAFRDRMIGWHVSPTAANVPGIKSELAMRDRAKEQDDGVVKSSARNDEAADDEDSRAPAQKKRLQLQAPRAPAPASVAPPPPPAPRPSEAPPPQAEPPADTSVDQTARPPAKTGLSRERPRTLGGPGGGSKQRPARNSEPETTTKGGPLPTPKALPDQTTAGADAVGQKDAEAERKPQTPAELVATDTTLRACLVSSLAVYGERVQASVGGELEVSYRLKNGALLVRLGRGLPTPDCAATWFTTHRAQLDATSTVQRVQVPLR